jgi:hypothetical protein
MNVEDADRSFFTALLAGDGAALSTLLAGDFVLIDVMRGAEVPRAEFIAAVTAGQLRFDSIERVGSRARHYGATSVVTGETRMRGHIGASSWSVHSRYAHIYVEQDGRWQMVSAQGTQIADA